MMAMVLLPLILAPAVGAAATRLPGPAGRWAPLGALAFEAGLLLRGPAGRADLLGASLELEPLGRLALLAGVAMAALAAISAHARPESQPAGLGALALAAAALLVQGNPPLAALLVESAALALAFAVVGGSGRAARAGARYVVLATLGGLALLVGTLLLGAGDSARTPGLEGVGVGLLAAGLAIVVAAFPVHLWLPGLAEEASPEDGALVLALLSGPAVVVVVRTLRAYQSALAGHVGGSVLVVAGVASAAGAALLALGPGPARRLACLASSALSFALVGLTGYSDVGSVGALFAVLVVPPAYLLGLLCLRAAGAVGPGAEQPGDVLIGLASRRPLLALGLAVSALSLAGTPPLAGFAGRWAVYVAASAAGDAYLLASLMATALAVLAAGRLVYPTLGSPALTPDPSPAGRVAGPRQGNRDAVGGARVEIVLLILAVVALGLQPAPVVDAIQAGLAGLGAAGG